MNADIIPTHYNERTLLTRRLALLDELDRLTRVVYHADDDDERTMENVAQQFAILENNFKDVANPIDLERGLKRIYDKRTYGSDDGNDVRDY